MQEDRDRRRAPSRYDRPTFGSTFTNPPGDYAGRLIEAVGLKGHRVGGAMWSAVHANFIVEPRRRDARADVLALMNLARARGEGAVRDRARDGGAARGRVPCRGPRGASGRTQMGVEVASSSSASPVLGRGSGRDRGIRRRTWASGRARRSRCCTAGAPPSARCRSASARPARRRSRAKGYDVTLVDVDLERRGEAPRAPRRRRVRRAARPLGRGRLRPGAARVDGDPVHRLGRHRLGDGRWTRPSRRRCSRRSASTSSSTARSRRSAPPRSAWRTCRSACPAS